MLVEPRAFAMSELSHIALSIRRLKFYAADLWTLCMMFVEPHAYTILLAILG